LDFGFWILDWNTESEEQESGDNAVSLALPPNPKSKIQNPKLSVGQRLLAAPGVSLLAWPVALLLLHLVHIPVSAPVVWAGVIAAGGLLAAGVWWQRRQRATAGRPPAPRSISFADVLFWATLAAVFGLTLISRWATIRDLVAGMGLDAY